MSLNQIELVWVRVRVEGECFWVNQREDNQVSESTDGSVWIQNGRIQDGHHHQVESRMNEWSIFLCKWWGGKCEWSFFLCKWWELILASKSVFERKNYDGWFQDGQIQDDRIQDGCHHHFDWEWMSLSQIELVWVRVRVEGEYFWVNLREENKVSEFQMQKLNPRWQNSRWLPSSS